ncbi:MAG: sensor histidine kinase [Chloroflexota bacterium]
MSKLAIDANDPRSANGVSSPIDTGLALVRSLNYLWLLIIIGLLVIGGLTTVSDRPTLWYTWRGPVMVLASLGVVGWYLLFPFIVRRFGWLAPQVAQYGHLTIGFVLVALLLSVSGNFVGLIFALIGASTALLPFRKTLLPIGVTVFMYLNATGLLPGNAPPHSFSDAVGALVSLATSVGIVYALTALIRERIQREQLFQELSAAHQRLRLSAAREADMAMLRERNRLARELHDSLGHALVSIAIKLEAAQYLYAVDAPRALAETEETTALVRSTMAELRHSLADLRPAPLEEQPLSDVLGEMTRAMEQRTGIHTTCAIDERAASLDRGVQEALYRVGQEALTNVTKHANATHVALALRVGDGNATLEVADDGVGVRTTVRGSAGRYGIVGMRERLDALGGLLTLGPRPDGGTVVRASIPLEAGT